VTKETAWKTKLSTVVNQASLKRNWAEVNEVNSAQWYGIAEIKLEQSQNSQKSGDTE
jgi:hypothetical protein